MNKIQLMNKLDKQVKIIRAAHEDDWSLEYLLEWLEELIEKEWLTNE